MSFHPSALLICLLIGVGICHSASLLKLRIERDTRNIPSNMFKPLNNPSNGNLNTSAVSSDFDETFSERSTGEAHVIDDPVAPKGGNFYRQQEDDYDDRTSFRSNLPRFNNPSRFNDPFPSGIRTVGYESTDNRRGFGNTGLFEIDNGPFRPLRSQTTPLMFTGTGPSKSFPDNGFGSSNNFYRSESYTYSSDGNGPPQVERNVYDSRLGNGFSRQNF